MCEELFSVGAVDNAMIKAEREIRHVPNCDVVFTVRRRENFGAFLDFADTQNSHLRLIDDGGAKQSAKHARVSDRESAASNFVRLELFGARAFGQVVVLMGGLMALAGMFLFSRRELATAQGTQ